jgi:hypothetical protein
MPEIQAAEGGERAWGSEKGRGLEWNGRGVTTAPITRS